MFLLDTDYAVLLQWERNPALARLIARMAERSPEEFYFPIIAFHEQMLGANAYISRAKSSEQVVRGYQMLHRILSDFSRAQVLPFDYAAMQVFQDFRKRRLRVATMDLRIGAIALSRQMTVLTRNLADFNRIPGVKVEDWTTAKPSP